MGRASVVEGILPLAQPSLGRCHPRAFAHAAHLQDLLMTIQALLASPTILILVRPAAHARMSPFSPQALPHGRGQVRVQCTAGQHAPAEFTG